MKKLITFSLWGDDPKYCVGAVRNAELALKVYPGWTCRFYIGSSVPFAVTEELIQVTKHWIRYAVTDDEVTAICGGSLEPVELEIYHMNDEPGDWRGMFWRFAPASERDVDVFISRDCDSRLTEREATAVQEWMDSPFLIHSMRDHPEHETPIMGGTWGAKRGAVLDMVDLMAKWDQRDKWQTDQEFLRAKVWPTCAHKVFSHDDWDRFEKAGKRSKFPTYRVGYSFVGQVFDENEMTVAEHVEQLRRVIDG